MKLVPVLVLAAFLAGCATPAADIDAAATLPVVISFAPPIAMAQPTGGAEPNIAVAPDGTLWITAVAGSQERPNMRTGAAWLWRSTDDGATWETLRAPQRDTPLGSLPQTRRPFGSSDADIVTSPDGWVYYSDWWNWGAPVMVPASVGGLSPNTRYGSYLVERSNDGGKTWESAPITTLDTFGGIDRQWLVAGPDGWVALFYAYFHGPTPTRPTSLANAFDGDASIQAVYSLDHGATWSEPRTVLQDDATAFSQIAHPRLTSEGLLWMPTAWATQQDGYWTEAGEVRIALSEDLGATWTLTKVADVPEGFDNLWAVQGDTEADGTMRVAWGARTGDQMTVFVATSKDGGKSWSEPLALRSEGMNFLPWVASKDGETTVTWYGSDATGEAVDAPDETEWWLYAATLRGDEVAVTRASPEPVKVGPMCAKGAACPSDRELLDYSGAVYGPDGRLHLTFASSREVAGAKAGLVSYMGTLS